MYKNLLFIVISVGISGMLSAQTLGEFSPVAKTKKSTQPKPNTSKEIYIANFSVNYQIFNQQEALKKGEMSAWGITGGTKTELAIGLDGLTAEELQTLTNELYNDFVNDLKTNGFTLVSDETAGKSKFYEKYNTYENIEMTMAEAHGVARFYPQNRKFYFKGMGADGKKKQGGFLNAIGPKTTDVGRASELMKLGKLSRELDDATIVDVNLYVLFLSSTKGGLAGGAKVGVQTHLHLADNEAIAFGESVKSFGVQGRKNAKTFQAISSVDAVKGGNKLNGYPSLEYTGSLKKGLEINGVIENKKVTAATKEARDSWGTQTAFGRLYSAEGKASSHAAMITPDISKYKAGVKEAVNTFLKYNAEEMAKKLQ